MKLSDDVIELFLISPKDRDDVIVERMWLSFLENAS